MSNNLILGTPLKGYDLIEFLGTIDGDWDNSRIYTYNGFEIKKQFNHATKKDVYYEVYRNLNTGETIKVGQTRHFGSYVITYV